jgi:hypothetical protein
MEANKKSFTMPNISELRAIVRLNIVNEDTNDVIFAARTRSTSTREEPHGYVEFSEMDLGFHAIIGTPNSANTVRMLADHKQKLGHRLIDKIVIFGEEDLHLVEPEKRSMAIILCHERPTPIPSPTEDDYPSKKRRIA